MSDSILISLVRLLLCKLEREGVSIDTEKSGDWNE